MRNSLIAIAVAGALSAGVATSASAAAAPTAAQAAAAPFQLVIAGSSAIRDALAADIQANVCTAANAMSLFKANAGDNPDIRAYSCTAGAGSFAGSLVTIYERSEGGSVTGVAPIVNPTVSISRLDLSASGNCTQTASGNPVICNAGGAITGNGLTDTYNLGTVKDFVQLGISDLPPAAFINENWGTDYTFIGAKPTQAALKKVNSVQLIEQTFGYAVNTTGITPAPSGVIQLSQNAIADIFAGNYTDWSSVPNATGTGTVSTTSVAIKLCNREPGSGTRTGTSIFLEGASNCSPSQKTIFDSHDCSPNSAATDCFTTTDERACITGNNGSIGYISIDNFSKFAAPVLPVAIGNSSAPVAPTSTQSALGQYAYIFEATANEHPTRYTGNAKTVGDFLIGLLQDITTTATTAQVSAIPGLTANNTPTIPLTTNAAKTVPVSDFSKLGDVCSRPLEQN
jgi:PBP superfamily domain